MSKKDKIVEMLKNDSSTEDICTELEVSTSYVYRVKREMDELEGDTGDPSKTEGDNSDGVAVNSSGGTGDNVEGNHEDVEEKKNGGKTDQTNRLGGIKKRKKTVKKSKKDTKDEEGEQSEHTGGVLKWMKVQWKKMLLVLMFLILLVIMMLSSSRMKKPETTPTMQANPSRYPVVTL